VGKGAKRRAHRITAHKWWARFALPILRSYGSDLKSPGGGRGTWWPCAATAPVIRSTENQEGSSPIAGYPYTTLNANGFRCRAFSTRKGSSPSHNPSASTYWRTNSIARSSLIRSASVNCSAKRRLLFASFPSDISDLISAMALPGLPPVKIIRMKTNQIDVNVIENIQPPIHSPLRRKLLLPELREVGKGAQRRAH